MKIELWNQCNILRDFASCADPSKVKEIERVLKTIDDLNISLVIVESRVHKSKEDLDEIVNKNARISGLLTILMPAAIEGVKNRLGS